MRVITGTARGKRLKTLEGLDVRPTSDKVKEAVFSIIQFDLPGAKVLDLFAGSGQLGIEALSRGAESCVFTDTNKSAAAVVRENLSACNFSDRAQVYVMSAESFLSSSMCRKADIALLDPPYSKGLIEPALKLLSEKLTADGIAVCEHEAGLELPEKIGRLTKHREYGYGKTVALTTYIAEET